MNAEARSLTQALALQQPSQTRRSGQPGDGARRQVLAGALTIAILLACVTTAVGWMRAAALDDAGLATQELARALGDQTERSLQALDLVVRGAVAHLADVTPPGDQLPADLGMEPYHATLRSQLARLPQAEALSVFDANGQMVSSTRGWPVLPMTVADHDYFQVLRVASRTQAYIGRPVQSTVTGEWIILLSHRIENSEGAFLGAVVGTLSLHYVEHFFEAVLSRPGSSVRLLARNGALLASHPHQDHPVPMSANAPEDWERLLAAGGGTVRLDADAGSPARIASFKALEGYPLVMEVALAEDAVLAGWNRLATGIMGGTLAAAFLITGLSHVADRRFTALVRSRAALAQHNQELERARARLEQQAADLAAAAAALQRSEQREALQAATLTTALENIDQGLMMVDACGTVAVCNQRAVDLLDLPPELMARHPQFTDVLNHQWQANEFSATSSAERLFSRTDDHLSALHVYERVRPNGTAIEVRSHPLPGGGVVRTYSDITERRAVHARIQHAAHHDSLTGLPNRACLMERLDGAVQAARDAAAAGQAASLAVLTLDLDRFKPINDTHGHAVGDRLLAGIAARMTRVAHPAMVARMGGDEFAIVQDAAAGVGYPGVGYPGVGHPGASQPGAAAALAAQVIAAVSEPFDIDGHRLSVGLSIGIATFPDSGQDASELGRNADIALYRAKDSGRNTFRVFDPTMDRQRQARFLLEHDLRAAVAPPGPHGNFRLDFQPMFDIRGAGARHGTVAGFEALLRWPHPGRGLVSPAEFVPLAEATGLILPLGRWVLEAACQEAARWPAPLRIAVNLSPLQFREDGLLQAITATLARTGLPPERLELEVTEGLLLEESGEVLQTMYALQALGISISLDDFGTGHAGLSYLRRFPFDKVKIDRSFIHNLRNDTQSGAIVEAILLLTRRLGLDVVAEGVETQAQLDLLRHLHCPMVQGYLTGRPMPAVDARRLAGCTAQAAAPGAAA